MFGGVHPSTVSKASVRFAAELARDRRLARLVKHALSNPGPDAVYSNEINKKSYKKSCIDFVVLIVYLSSTNKNCWRMVYYGG